VLAEAIAGAIGDEPVVLLGHSAGGLLAHALAGHLERAGTGPHAVVLLDTVLPGASPEPFFERLCTGLFERESAFGRFDATMLSALGGYLGLVGQCPIRQIAAPTLLIQAERTIVSDIPFRDMETIAHTLIELAGGHNTLVEEGAEATVLAIEKWLE